MTWLLLSVLGLLSTGLMYPNYQWMTPILEEITEQQQVQEQMLLDEFERNHQAEQKQIAIEDYFTFADKIGKIIYARWCAWGYEVATKWADGKYHNCNKKAFDCWWAMKAYLVAKGILDKKDISLYNSNTLYDLWIKKDPRTAERWDFMYRRWFGKAASWKNSTHFSVVSRNYNPGDRTMWIYDNVVPWGTDKFHEREIPISCNATMCHYAGMFRIYVSTNGVFELTQQTGKEITPRVNTTTEEALTWVVLMSVPPTVITGVATRYDYDLEWQARSKSHNTCALRITDRYGTYRVTNLDNGKSVDCFQNDYGPKEYTNKIIDLSSHAFAQIGSLKAWVANVSIYRIK